jgi:hypothetical protein
MKWFQLTGTIADGLQYQPSQEKRLLFERETLSGDELSQGSAYSFHLIAALGAHGQWC